MEVIFPAPQFLLWIVIGIIVLTVPAVLLKKGKWHVKAIALIVIIITCGLLLFFFYRDTRLAVTEEGIYSNSYGEFHVQWTDMNTAFLIDDLNTSEYRPTVRTNGYAMGEVGFGWFALKNGNNARVVLQTRSRCLMILTEKMTYLFAPLEFDTFIQAVKQYITIDVYEVITDDSN